MFFNGLSLTATIKQLHDKFQVLDTDTPNMWLMSGYLLFWKEKYTIFIATYLDGTDYMHDEA